MAHPLRREDSTLILEYSYNSSGRYSTLNSSEYSYAVCIKHAGSLNCMDTHPFVNGMRACIWAYRALLSCRRRISNFAYLCPTLRFLYGFSVENFFSKKKTLCVILARLLLISEAITSRASAIRSNFMFLCASTLPLRVCTCTPPPVHPNHTLCECLGQRNQGRHLFFTLCECR